MPGLAAPVFARHYLMLAAVALAAMGASLIAAPGLRGLFGGVLAAIMLVIAAIDARRFLIPDPLIALALIVAVANVVLIDEEPAIRAVALAGLRAAVAAGAFYSLMVLYERLRGRPGIGLGDVKLAAAAGAWLDWTGLVVAIELAAVAALFVQVLRSLVLGRKLRRTQAVPFGLYFAPAIWLAWLIDAVWLNP